MSASILVTYATRYGSTQEVAEAIAEKLRQTGLVVDIQPTQEVRNLGSYSAVVLGAPLYIGKWHKDAHQFLSTYFNTLTQRPIAIFALGPISRNENEMQGSREQLKQELGRYPWLKPVSVEMFVGKYDPKKLSFLHSVLTTLPASPLHNLAASDQRDWEAIRAWAGSIAAKFQSAVPQ